MIERFQAISTVIIGEGSLPLQCSDLLLNQGHTIVAVVTSDRALQAWAQQRELPVYTEPTSLPALLTATSVDYLLSISNPQIIPTAVLALPRRGAINYHDAPLPRYAGVFATSWAILHGESQHGITWHWMTAQIDGGDILQQRLVTIDPHDTAFTLNGKCFEAAIHAFTDLLHDLAHNCLQPTPQNLRGRSYFARHQRPPAGAVIDWQESAEAINRLCHALTFGPYPNPLAAPKLLLGSDLFVIAEIERGEVTASLASSHQAAAPGTLLALTTERMTVATATSSLVIKKLLTLNGEAQPFSALAERYGLQVGMALPILPSPLAERLTAQNNTFCKHESFWLNRLRALALPDLPYRYPTPKIDAPSAHITLPLPIDAAIPTWLASQGWRSTEFFAALFALYLGRVCRSTAFDLAFTPASLTAALQGTVAFFASQVPLHIELAANASFVEFYQTLAAEIDTVRRKGSYARDLVARQPDLRNNGEVQRWPQASVAIQETTEVGCPLLPTNLLTLALCPASGQAVIHFDSAQVDAAAIHRMVGHLQTLMAGVIADPSTPIATLPLLTAAERQQILLDWNNTSTPYPQGKCLHHLFEEQVVRTPEAVAVDADKVTGWQGDKVNEDTAVTLSPCHLVTLSYRTLDAHANQLAHYLQTLGIGPDTPVAVCLERSAALSLSFLAVLKAGGAYLPLDLAYPAERLGFILQDANAPVLLTQQSLLPILPVHGATVVCLDRDWPLIAGRPCHAPTSTVTADHVAYIVYTSGSTGQPKGALLEHDGLCSITPAVIRLYDLQVGSRLLQFISPGFDVAVCEMAMVLCSGATLVMADKECLQLGPALTQTLQEATITHVELPPAVLATLDPTQFPLITTVITGGEVCPAEVVVRWSRGRKFFNAYGPTEATNTNTICDCRDYQPPTPGQSPSIGKPVANKVVYILDDHRQPVPVGVPGELYIGGAGIARGYLNRLELTAERFVALTNLPHPNPPLLGEGTVPFPSREGLGWGLRVYKTGDLVHWLPDGNIDFIGRIDTQVKLRGFRIELGEIENVLTSHPAVRQAVVIVREDHALGARLVAYVVLNKKTDAAQSLDLSISPAELRSFLQAKLPEHMVPAAIVLLENLPLTAHGKVDRRALPAPSERLVKRQGRYMEPRSIEEFDLAALWEAVLGVEQISIDENFFALGGNSLLALQLIVKIREKFSKQFPMGTLLQYPTIVEFSPLLQQSSAPGLDRWVSLLPLQPKGSRPNFYCITPSGHDGIYFYPLAMALGGDQPFYTLRLPSLSGLVPPPASIEEAATFYYKEIKRVQPHGPYHLAGHSFGGVVAFELAQQMHRAGDAVGFLGLFDCEAGDYALVKPLNVLTYTMRFVDYFVNTYSRPGQSEIPIHREMTVEKLANLSVEERVAWAYEVLRQTYAPQAENLDEVRGMLLSAIAGFQYIYQPKEVTPLPFTFFVAGDLKPEDAQRRIDYWSRLGVIDVCTIPGDHESMLTDAQNRALLARELSNRLQAAYHSRRGDFSLSAAGFNRAA